MLGTSSLYLNLLGMAICAAGEPLSELPAVGYANRDSVGEPTDIVVNLSDMISR